MNINSYIYMCICLLLSVSFLALQADELVTISAKKKMVNEHIVVFMKGFIQEDGSLLIHRTNKSIPHRQVTSSRPSTQLWINLHVLRELILFTQDTITSSHTTVEEKSETQPIYQDYIAVQKDMRTKYRKRKQLIRKHRYNKKAESKLVANTDS